MTSIQNDNPDETVQPLPEDNEPPFSPPTSPVDDASDQTFDRKVEDGELDVTHPATDSKSDLHEQYDAGLSAAAEASEPNAGNDVVDYDPDKDLRKSEEETNG